MADEKDRLGETLRLLERAKEDIYFAQRDRELIEKLRAQLKKVEKQADANELRCPKCRGYWKPILSRNLSWSAARNAAAFGWIMESSKGSSRHLIDSHWARGSISFCLKTQTPAKRSTQRRLPPNRSENSNRTRSKNGLTALDLRN